MGDSIIAVPRDRNGEFEPVILKKYQTNSNEIEVKVVTLYARGLSTRDIQATLQDIYGIELSPAIVSNITEKI